MRDEREEGKLKLIPFLAHTSASSFLMASNSVTIFSLSSFTSLRSLSIFSSDNSRGIVTNTPPVLYLGEEGDEMRHLNLRESEKWQIEMCL